MIDLIEWDEIFNDFNLRPIEFLEWYGIIQSTSSNWKESIPGNPTNREVYNSVSRDGETIIINNVAMEIKAIKIRHTYKHLISGKVKRTIILYLFSKKFLSRRGFCLGKSIHVAIQNYY